MPSEKGTMEKPGHLVTRGEYADQTLSHILGLYYFSDVPFKISNLLPKSVHKSAKHSRNLWILVIPDLYS